MPVDITYVTATATTVPNTAAAGVTAGLTDGNAIKIQNRAVAATAPTNGQAIVWSTANNDWEPGTVSGGGGGPTFERRTAAGPYTPARLAWRFISLAYANAFTLKLPTDAVAGDRLEIDDELMQWGTNNLTVDPQGQTINGDGSSLIVDIDGACMSFTFLTTGKWGIV